jgi:hypothetical protein
MSKPECTASMPRTVWLLLVVSAVAMWLNLAPSVVADGGSSEVPIQLEDSIDVNSSGGGDSVSVVVVGETSISMTILLELWGLLF